MTSELSQDMLSSLASAVDDCAAGRGGIVLLSGPVGSGASRILRSLENRGLSAGTQVLSTLCSWPERNLRLGVLSSLLRGDGAGLQRARRVLAEISPEPARSATAGLEDDALTTLSPQAAERMGSTLLALTRDGPVVMLVDDLHHADAPSLQCLLHLARRIRSEPFLLVVSDSPSVSNPHVVFRSELARQRHARWYDLACPSVKTVADRLSRRFDPGTASRVAEQVWTVAHGNPFLVEGLIADLRTDTLGDDPKLTIGPGFQAGVVSYLSRCDPAMLRVAQGVAALSDHVVPDLLASLVGLDVRTTEQLLRALDQAGLVSDGRFLQPEAEAAVWSLVDLERRPELHRAAAALLHQGRTPALAVARQAMLAGGMADSWVVPILRDGAEEALAEDDVEAAVAYLQLAERLCPAGTMKAELVVRLATITLRMSPATAARHLAALAVSAPGIGPTLQQAALAGRVLGWVGSPEAGAAIATVADLAGTRSQQDAEELRVVELWLATHCPELSTSLRGLAAGPVAVEAGTVRPRLKALDALNALLTTGHDPRVRCEGLEVAEQILHSSNLRDDSMDPVSWALDVLIYGDGLDRAALWSDLFLARTQQLSAPWWQALMSGIRAEVAWRQGDLATAESLARAATTLADPKDWGVAIGLPQACLINVATATGRYDAALEELHRFVPAAMYGTRYGLHYLHARGNYLLATGQARAALEDFMTCGALMERWGMDFPGLVPWRTAAAWALLDLGRHDEARELVHAQLSTADRQVKRTYGLTLRALAATVELRKRPRILRKAVELLNSAGDRYELARVLRDTSHAFTELGRPGKAEALLQFSLEAFRHTGAPAESEVFWHLTIAGAGAEQSAATGDSRQSPRSPWEAADWHGGREGWPQVPAPHGAFADANKTTVGACEVSKTVVRAPVAPNGGSPRTPAGSARGQDFGEAFTEASGSDFDDLLSTSLSKAERRVAALAALGHTNRDIAQRLYITVSTVEQHLTRVYRKLNVTGRHDLLTQLRSSPGASSLRGRVREGPGRQ